MADFFKDDLGYELADCICGARSRNLDICPACKDRLDRIITAMVTKGTVDIFD